MPRGQPDYGVYQQQWAIAGLADLGEAVARLDSINIYDRRGFTAWMDSFEPPVLRWTASASAGGTAPVLSTTQQWMGVQSVYFVTAAVAGEWSQLIKVLPLIRLGKVGIEFSIYLDCQAPGYFQVLAYIFDGTNRRDADLRLDNRARTASIVTPAGLIPVATNCFPAWPVQVWTSVKLVVDMDTDMYTRLLIGDREFPIHTHALVPGAPTTSRFIQLTLRLQGDLIAIMDAYLDNFILTQNEP